MIARHHFQSTGRCPARGVISLLAIALLAAGVVPASLAQAPASAPAPDSLELMRAQQEAFRAAAERVKRCVVTIETVGGTQPVEGGAAPTTGPGNRRRGPAQRPGFIVADGPTTGLIYSPDGLIITSSFNFVRDPSVITVILPDGRRFVGELLARDEVRRLAMLRINATDLPVPEWIRDRGALRVGQWVIALGRGFGGPEPSLTAGIISGLNRQAGLAVQTDAKLSPANFGGPLLDLDGRVIGINVPMGTSTGELAGLELYDSGIGFAVPAWQIEAVAKDLADGHNLRRGLLGVGLDRRVSDRIVISGVASPSPAERAGLQRGDVIRAIDDQPVGTYLDLQRIMRARLAGQRVRLKVRRGGEDLEITVVLAVPEDLGPIADGSREDEPPTTQPEEESEEHESEPEPGE